MSDVFYRQQEINLIEQIHTDGAVQETKRQTKSRK